MLLVNKRNKNEVIQLKRIFIAIALVMGLASLSKATVKTPVDQRGMTLPVIDWVGASACTLQNGDSTTGKLCTSGAGMVYGLIISSDSASNFALFRDTNTANVTSSTFSIVFGNGTGANASGANTTQIFKFPVPVSFTNGLSINVNSAVAVGGEWTILYRKLVAPEN